MGEDIRAVTLNEMNQHANERRARIKLGSSQSIGPAASHRVKAALHMHSADIIDELNAGHDTASDALEAIEDVKRFTKGINPSTTLDELREKLSSSDIPPEALDLENILS